MRQRTKLAVNAGNLLELIGAACAVFAVAHLAGVEWGILLAGILVVVAAELIYDEHVWRFPLPLRPQPSRWARERRQAVEKWRIQRVALKAIARQRALDDAPAAPPADVEIRG